MIFPLYTAGIISIPTWCDWWIDVARSCKQRELFQFLHGAIGGNARLYLYQLFAYFNSYMVRLVEPIQCLTCPKLNQFQFLHGAIGGISLIAEFGCVPSFQFLHGAIGGQVR